VTPATLLYLVQTPAARPRTLAGLAAEAEALALELGAAAAADANGWDPDAMCRARTQLEDAARILRDAFEDAHALKLAELELLCAHCGHSYGEHFVEAPHVCEEMTAIDASALDVTPCGCPGFVPPGVFHVVRDTERPPPPPLEDVP
jgi:hypothetical protein